MGAIAPARSLPSATLHAAARGWVGSLQWRWGVDAGWLIGIPLGYGLARGLVALVQNVFNQHLLFAFPAPNIPIALIGTIVLALLVMQVPLRRAVRFRAGEALRYA